MATQSIREGQVTSSRVKPLIGGIRFDCVYIVACLWLVIGADCDAWAHVHMARLETFFTLWHAVLYSGVAAVFFVLVGTVLINHSRGVSWREAVPIGYEGALLGILLFPFVGVSDMMWHILFGIEKDVEAQFSPTHVAGMVASALVLFGPYCSYYQRIKEAITWGQRALLLIATILIFEYVNVTTQTEHPYGAPWPAFTPRSDVEGQLLGMAIIMLQGIILTGLVLYTVRRWKLFSGYFTLAYTIAAAPMVVLRDDPLVLIMAFGAGIFTDIAYRVVQPSLEKPDHFRLFAALLSVAYYVPYFLVIQFLIGSQWSIHLSVGSIVISAIFGWVLTYLIIPSRISE